MFRYLTSRVRKDILPIAYHPNRSLGTATSSKKQNTKNEDHLNTQRNKIRINFKNGWNKNFQSSSRYNTTQFKDDIIKCFLGVVSLTSIIIGHKWMHKDEEKEKCPVHQITKAGWVLPLHIHRHGVLAINCADEANPSNNNTDKSENELAFDEVLADFEQVSNECSGSLLNRVANKLANEKEEKKALKMFKEASSLGNVNATYNVGISYERGIGTEKSYKMAAEYYKKAGDQDHMKALYNLASLYYGGYLKDSDSIEKGFAYAKRAADLGLAQAQLFVGLRYAEEKTYHKAFHYFQEGTKQKDVSSIFNLAVCYDHGYGTNRDSSKALDLYQLAGERGHMFAQFSIAESYQYGLRGCSKDPNKALEWYVLARENGNPEAAGRIEEVQFELKEREEKELLKIFESNNNNSSINMPDLLIDVLNKQLLPPLNINSTKNFHKSSSMPSLKDYCFAGLDGQRQKKFYNSMGILPTSRAVNRFSQLDTIVGSPGYDTFIPSFLDTSLKNSSFNADLSQLVYR